MDTRVTITGVDIPFGQLVVLILKWMLASIPAMIIMWIGLAIIAALFSACFGAALFGSMGGW